MWKIKLEKIVANLSDIKASKIVHEWNGHIEIVGCPEVMKILSNICFSEQMF